MVGCHWDYTVKFNPVNRLKICLVKQGFSPTMILIILRYSLPWLVSAPFSAPFAYYLLLLSIWSGPSFNWMSKILLFIAIYKRKFIWINFQDILLRGRIWFRGRLWFCSADNFWNYASH